MHAATPYGHATYRAFMMTIYDADLWTDATTWTWDKPFALTLTYRMAFDTDEMIDKSIDEMNSAAEGGDEAAAHEGEFRKILAALMPSVADGDRVTALYIPQKSLTFFHNGQETGSTHNLLFTRHFLSIWLSPTMGNHADFTRALTTPAR